MAVDIPKASKAGDLDWAARFARARRWHAEARRTPDWAYAPLVRHADDRAVAQEALALADEVGWISFVLETRPAHEDLTGDQLAAVRRLQGCLLEELAPGRWG